MTKDMIPGSKGESYEDQYALVADHAECTGWNYELPDALEAAVVMLLPQVWSRDHLSSNQYTYTRCQESGEGSLMIFGGSPLL